MNPLFLYETSNRDILDYKDISVLLLYGGDFGWQSITRS